MRHHDLAIQVLIKTEISAEKNAEKEIQTENHILLMIQKENILNVYS